MLCIPGADADSVQRCEKCPEMIQCDSQGAVKTVLAEAGHFGICIIGYA